MSDVNPQPAGFPHCPQCAWLDTAQWAVCYSCARETIDPVPDDACPTCSQRRVSAEAACRNKLCRSSERVIAGIQALSMLSDPLEGKIKRYKYPDAGMPKTGWARIFGRLLLGHLESHYESRDVGLVVAMPTWTGPGGRPFAHTERVLQEAERWDAYARWPWDTASPRLLTAAGPKPQSAGSGWEAKRDAAGKLRDTIQVNDPHGKVRGARVIVYDDICTTGLSLEAVARCLTMAGAAEVVGVVLARKPWTF